MSVLEGTKQHAFAYNPNPHFLTWERLEQLRLQKLGLGHRYSRHLNVVRCSSRNQTPNAQERERTLALQGPPRSELRRPKRQDVPVEKKNNSIAPFATLEKPTCGFFFSDLTNNKKRNFGIPASDLVKWRTFQSTPN